MENPKENNKGFEPSKFDDSPEWIGEVASLIGIALVCWYDWRLGVGIFLMFGRIYRYAVLATRRSNAEISGTKKGDQ